MSTDGSYFSDRKTLRHLHKPPPSVIRCAVYVKTLNALCQLPARTLAYTHSSPMGSAVCRRRSEKLTWPYSTSMSALCCLCLSCRCMILTSAYVNSCSSSSSAEDKGDMHKHKIKKKYRVSISYLMTMHTKNSMAFWEIHL